MRQSSLALLAVLAFIPVYFLGQGPSGFNWKAFHRANDREWSQKTGLPPEDIRRLRLAADIKDDEPSNPIDSIDAKTLGHERILLVTAAGSGHCLTVAVYQRHGRGFQQLWSSYSMPDEAGYCHPSLCRDAAAWATKKNQVVVSVPVQREGAEMGICDEDIVLTFQGTGKTYSLVKTDHLAAACTIEDIKRGLSEAFASDESSDSAGIERLATVFALPSFGREWAIVINKTANGLQVKRLAFREQAFRKISLFSKRQTPTQCIAEIKSIPIDGVAASISQQEAQRLVDELSKIDRNADSCPREPQGTCAHLMDGLTYTLVFPDGWTVQLTEIEGLENIRSENQALLNWVHELSRYVEGSRKNAAQ